MNEQVSVTDSCPQTVTILISSNELVIRTRNTNMVARSMWPDWSGPPGEAPCFVLSTSPHVWRRRTGTWLNEGNGKARSKTPATPRECAVSGLLSRDEEGCEAEHTSPRRPPPLSMAACVRVRVWARAGRVCLNSVYTHV